MPVADVAQPLKIADRRQQHAGRSRHRLDDHRRDRLCPMQIDEPLEIVGEFGAMLRKSARKGVACQIVRVAQMIGARQAGRSEEHTSELQSLMRISYAVFCLKKKNTQ